MSSLPEPSDEQGRIVGCVVGGGSGGATHVRVDAVAGAGKTTTILHVALALPRLPILVLTYNAKLKSETRARCDTLAIHNVAVHTYHSAALNLYGDAACARDEGIADLLRRTSQRPASGRQNSFGLLVVDEAQDMTRLYFALTKRLILDACIPDVRVVVLGDARQSVYGFKGADTRFLTLAHRLPAFASAAASWTHLTLATSYRLAPNIARFVNSQLLEGVEVLKSNHGADGPSGRVRYLRCNVFGDMPFRQISAWLRQDGLSASDIFVLAPSIRVNLKQSPLRMLENRLVRAGIRCHAASSDEERLDEDVTRGKVVFATFHQVKGLERKAVLVFNFDASYHRFYERDAPSGEPVVRGCPNPIYVAVTRAMQHLTVLHDAKQPALRTIRSSLLRADCELVIDGSATNDRGGGGARKIEERVEPRVREMSVTELLRHQKQDVMAAALACIQLRADPGSECDSCEPVLTTLLKSKTNTGGDSWENVSAITGTAIPCMFEYETTGGCTLLRRASCTPKSLPAQDRDRIAGLCAKTPLTVADFLYIANVHITLTAGFTHKLRQIEAYDWVQAADVAAMLSVMRWHLADGHAVVYEFPASLTLSLPGRRTRVNLSCAIDCLSTAYENKTAFEIKCVSCLASEHTLQTALNALLLERGGGAAKGYRHILINLCDGSRREIVVGDGSGLLRAATILLEAKCADEEVTDDQTFIDSLCSPRVGDQGHPCAQQG